MYQLYSELKEENKKENYIMTRWSIPFAGFLLALMGGLSYAWGVFVVPMEKTFGWSTAEATLPFTVFMIVFALVMVPAGWLQDKIGPRKVAAIGAALFFVAYSLSALVDYIPLAWWLVITYGVIGGIACGTTYACVAPPARKWFPDKPGFAISLSVMGFGLAALGFAPLKRGYIIPMFGIGGTFLFLAIMTSVVCFLAALLIKNPPDGWMPPGWNPDKDIRKTVTANSELTPKEVVRSPVFWNIWLTFALVTAGGFIALGLIPSYGERVVGLTPVMAAVAIAIFSGVNGFGRPVAGFLGDMFGIVWIMIITYVIQTATFLSFPIFAVTLPTLYIAAALLGWGYAVTLALFPGLTSICFGTKHLGANYGLVFTAFGVGALAPSFGSWIFDVTGSYTPAFVFAGITTGIGLVLCVFFKKKYALP